MAEYKTGPYSEAEVTYLERSYARFGPTHCARVLGRRMHNVAAKATRLGLEFGALKGFVTTLEVAATTGKNNSAIWSRARRDGVLKIVGKCQKRALVPASWANAVIEQAKLERQGDEAREAGYLRIKEAAAYLGVGYGTIQRGLKGEGYLARLKLVRVLVGKRGTININPFDLEQVRLDLQAERDVVRALPSAKSLWLDTDLNRSTAMTRHKKLRVPVKALKGGRIQTFFKNHP